MSLEPGSGHLPTGHHIGPTCCLAPRTPKFEALQQRMSSDLFPTKKQGLDTTASPLGPGPSALGTWPLARHVARAPCTAQANDWAPGAGAGASVCHARTLTHAHSRTHTRPGRPQPRPGRGIASAALTHGGEDSLHRRPSRPRSFTPPGPGRSPRRLLKREGPGTTPDWPDPAQPSGDSAGLTSYLTTATSAGQSRRLAGRQGPGPAALSAHPGSSPDSQWKCALGPKLRP